MALKVIPVEVPRATWGSTYSLVEIGVLPPWEERLIWMWGIKKGEHLKVTITREYRVRAFGPRDLGEWKECCFGERGVLGRVC